MHFFPAGKSQGQAPSVCLSDRPHSTSKGEEKGPAWVLSQLNRRLLNMGLPSTPLVNTPHSTAEGEQGSAAFMRSMLRRRPAFDLLRCALNSHREVNELEKKQLIGQIRQRAQQTAGPCNFRVAKGCRLDKDSILMSLSVETCHHLGFGSVICSNERAHQQAP